MLLTIIIFLVVLSVLVLVHELGHFWTARRFGVGAEEFGLGFPPRVFGIYKNKEGKWKKVKGGKEVLDAVGTIYSINAIPLGGFVKIKGEDGEGKNESDSFASRPIWQRFLILAAGVSMNILLAFVLFSICLGIGMPSATDGPGRIQIEQVMEKSPAANAGVLMGDVVLSADEKTFTEVVDLQNYINSRAGQKVNLEIKRGDETLKKEVEPKVLDGSSDKAIMGVMLTKTEMIKYPWYQAIWEGFKYTFALLWMIIIALITLFKDLIMGHGVGDAVGGPVKIAQMTGEVARVGFVYLLNFTALLSLNLAVINFLPFPALDGGRSLFLLIEKLRGRPMKKEIETVMHNVGFLLLMALVAWVTLKDIIKLF